jgi:hypothetical protein
MPKRSTGAHPGDLPVVKAPDRRRGHPRAFREDYHRRFVGTGREASGIAAERKLARDVRDFLAQAKVRKLP